MRLYPLQADLDRKIHDTWDRGVKNVLAVSPTGSGKTVIFSNILLKHNGPSCAIAHRQELVTQISLALARDEVKHRIIGSKDTVKLAENLQMDELGRSFYHPSAPCAVAGVDTLIKRVNNLSYWANSVTKWVQDEGHHVLKNNKWGTAAAMFPNAVGLGVTATPERADGKGLGRHSDGLYDEMIVGPSGRELINKGFLTDYRIFAPPSDIDLSNVNISETTGDFNINKLRAAVKKSHIIGDVVKHYLKIAPGKLGVTFATDVETATNIAGQFNLAGIPAAVISAKTPTNERIALLRKFKNRELLMLVNVDLFGEGFDLPAIEVVIMARPTESFALYCQQFGRALRLMLSPMLLAAWGNYTDKQRIEFIATSEKPHAIIIDHVGNITRHGLPDAKRHWSLDGRNRRSKKTNDDGIPVRTCLNPDCLAAYERIYKKCPYCGFEHIPAARSGPEFVDGDLTELDPFTLAAMRGEVDHANMDLESYRAECVAKYMPEIGIRANVKRHGARLEILEALKSSISWWAGIHRYNGKSDGEIYSRFYFKFGVDILTAQGLKTKEAYDLAQRVNDHLGDLINEK